MNTSNANSSAIVSAKDEETLRIQLRRGMQDLKADEPIEPTYKRLILNIVPRRPTLSKDKRYKKIGSGLRDRVEAHLARTQQQGPFDILAARQEMEEDRLRAAFTLREPKEHELLALVEAHLASQPRRRGMDEATRRRHLEGVAMTLQRKKKATPTSTTSTTKASAKEQFDADRKKKEAAERENARQKHEDDQRRQRHDELLRQPKPATPQHALHRLYYPIFRKLWDMEFPYLGNTNPFRVVIDRSNCAQMGAPDYFQVIQKPMNLTYIQDKVDKLEYMTFKEFRDDVELMIKNALAYNTAATNPYRQAAQELRKLYAKLLKKVLAAVSKQQK